MYFCASTSATAASRTAQNITKWLKMVDVIQNGWKTSLNKTKDKLDYINLKLLEVQISSVFFCNKISFS